jgi:hypothetical protein
MDFRRKARSSTGGNQPRAALVALAKFRARLPDGILTEPGGVQAGHARVLTVGIADEGWGDGAGRLLRCCRRRAGPPVLGGQGPATARATGSASTSAQALYPWLE